MPTSRFNWRHQYDDERDRIERSRARTFTQGDTLTEQHHTPNVNINVMMKRMGVTDGAIPPHALSPQYYGDFTEATDLRGVFDRVREATDRFNELPASIRAQFNNDPATLTQWVLDPANAQEAVEMGLLSQLAAPEVPKETVAADPTPSQ